MDGPAHTADPASRDCIDCNVEFELAFWAGHFRVSPSDLQAVVAAVGCRVSDVTAEIAIRKGALGKPVA